MSIYYNKNFCFATVDPGLRGCGVAIFKGGNLSGALYVPNSITDGRGYNAHAAMGAEVHSYLFASITGKIIIEHPRIYPGSAQQKGDLNDLIDVACVGAAISAMFPVGTVETVFPADWRGQVPKEVMTERISRAISNDERRGIEKCYASLMHNVLDAIGIGLWKLGRINQKRIHNE